MLGLQIAPGRSILVPTAHDEPAIHLDIYKEMFSLPAAVAYNTEVERRFLTTHFPIRAVAEETVGCGVDLPASDARERPVETEDPRHEPDTDVRRFDGYQPLPPHITERGAVFRRRHRLHGPFVLYGGRIDPGKGCEELIEYFSSYVADGGDATLALMGVKLMKLPDEPFIRFAGLLSERERLRGPRSRHGRLGALALREPVAAGARSVRRRHADTRERAQRGAGGALHPQQCGPVLRRPRRVRRRRSTCCWRTHRLRAAMGRNGREYVTRNYRWDVILAKYDTLIGR